MPTKTLPVRLYEDWLRQFMREASADAAHEIQRHIDYLKLDCSSGKLLKGTRFLVSAVIANLSMDGRNSECFIAQQKYRLCGKTLPHYILTFDLGKHNFGRLLADRNISRIDFADLFNHPWHAFETIGFNRVYISRLDGQPFDPGETGELERRFTQDIYYDYSEQEVSATLKPTELGDTVLAEVSEILIG